MFAFSPTPRSPAAQQDGWRFLANTCWRGLVASVLCAFAMGCATSHPVKIAKAPLKPIKEVSEKKKEVLPPKAKALLANASQLLEHLANGQMDQLQDVMNQRADAINPRLFAVTSKTMKRLGAVKNTRIEGFQHKNGVYVGTFNVEFESISTELMLATKNDQLLGWEFTGKEMEQQLSYTFFDSFKQLTIITSSLQDAQGNQTEAVFDNGERLQFNLMIAGFERRTNFAHVRMNMHLKDDKGKLLRTVTVVDNNLRIKKDEPPAISLSAWLALTEPGNYTVELEVQDVYSENSLVHAQNIKIKGQGGAAFSKVLATSI